MRLKKKKKVTWFNFSFSFLINLDIKKFGFGLSEPNVAEVML